MMGFNLASFATDPNYFIDNSGLRCARGFYFPGFWVAAAIRAKDLRLNRSQLRFEASETEGYAMAMGFHSLLGSSDPYPHTRHNNGVNYSNLVVLDSPAVVDAANSRINECIRQFCPNSQSNKGINELVTVVGELHDNVWSHGEATGISMAQRFPGNDTIEFAVADGGCGFFRELKKSGINVTSHREAIEWCIQEGNTSKDPALIDDWAQSMPWDMHHNPHGPGVPIRRSENNHQGLGLHKLKCLVETYSGFLQLWTGDCLMMIDNSGKVTYDKVSFWRGVAISCSFNQKLFESASTQPPDNIVSLMDQLRERAT